MARRTISIDEKVEKAQEDVARAKERYDSALEELKLLLEKKDEQKKAELISVIDGCGMSYDEIINLLKTKSRYTCYTQTAYAALDAEMPFEWK